ncbi:MAG: hypothetical protein SOT34_00865 [Candidatus Borkfalkiaceae bacterium]|nr:hypothetical protein [Christensenellaceae bacterium]
MKKIIRATAGALALLTGCAAMYGCKKKNEPQTVYERVADERRLDDFAYTVNSVSATDRLGRTFSCADTENKEKYVGIFYFLWLGQHRGAGQNGIYDITDLLANDPDSLWDISPSNKVSPVNAYHFWGEPLYGYYDSADEWVIRKHVELFVLAGIDFLCFDTTNAFTYPEVALKVMEVLRDYASQGWKVPRVMYYTNSSSVRTMEEIYRTAYLAHPEYEDLWFSPNGKPMIVGVRDDLIEDYDENLNPVYKEEYRYLLDFFEIKDSQWPNEKTKKENGFPWMEFTYPQHNYNGVMNVSVAQHTTVRMSNQADGNWGRGYDRENFVNDEKRGEEGINYQSQWQTVFDAGDDVQITFITGWNEWIALKLPDTVQNKAFFVDTFSENYSRDIEPMLGGYGDNFYLQTAANIRKFKYSAPKHYLYETYSPANLSDGVWEQVRAYRDFVGDCRDRNGEGFYKNPLTDDSGRNDIESVRVTHDGNNLYFRITCAEAITSPLAGDRNWMNVYVGTDVGDGYRYGDYQYVINREPNGNVTSVERFTAFGKTEKIGEAKLETKGRDMMLTVPLSLFSLSEQSCHILFKIADNVEPDEDFANFYRSGDSAPIGRLGYHYGY